MRIGPRELGNVEDITAREGMKDTIESIVIALVLAFVFRAFVVEAFVIPTGSMAPRSTEPTRRSSAKTAATSSPTDSATRTTSGGRGRRVPGSPLRCVPTATTSTTTSKFRTTGGCRKRAIASWS